jgi:regulatory protein
VGLAKVIKEAALQKGFFFGFICFLRDYCLLYFRTTRMSKLAHQVAFLYSFQHMKFSPEIAYSKLVDWCNKAERCRHDIKQKLVRWQADKEFIASCIDRLEKSNLLSDERFASAFAHDKSTLQRWGSNKIRMYLKARSISEDNIQHALATIQSDVQDENLQELIQRKWPATKGKSEFERTSKLIQYLMRKGFSYDSIKKNLAQSDIFHEEINPL